MSESNEPEYDFELEEKEFSPHGVTKVSLPPTVLARRVLWDVLPCPKVVPASEALGMSPASADVHEIDHAAAHGRVEPVKPLAPVLHDFAVYTANAIRGGIMVQENMVMDEEAERSFMMQFVPALFQHSVAVLAELASVGMITINPPNMTQTEWPK